MSEELNLNKVVQDLQSATNNLDKFAQAANSKVEDNVLRARFTQCLVLIGTGLEILGGINAQATAAAAAKEEATAEPNLTGDDVPNE